MTGAIRISPPLRQAAVIDVPSSLQRRRRSALMLSAAWTAYGLLHAALWIATTRSGQASPWTLVAVSLLVAWGWAALTPLIFALSRKVAPARVGWGLSLGAHAIAIVLSTLVVTAFRVRLLTLFWGDPFVSLSSYAERLVFWSDVNLFTYLAIVATWRAHDSHRKYIDRALRAHQLQTQLARAQLHYLELQLQPHFLFNSLNAIQELAHEAPRAAERMLRKLHTLLGLSLARSGHDEVSLDEELAALEPYIDIQRTRFSEWLTVRQTSHWAR